MMVLFLYFVCTLNSLLVLALNRESTHLNKNEETVSVKGDQENRMGKRKQVMDETVSFGKDQHWYWKTET